VHPEPDGTLPLERFADAIDERTALVCCTTVSYRTGHRHDVAAIARLAHERGALCLADSYQAVGAVDLDAHGLDVDVITGGTVNISSPRRGSRSRISDGRRPHTSCRPRPAGSRTRTSSRWTSPITRRRETPAVSRPERRPCRTSTPARPVTSRLTVRSSTAARDPGPARASSSRRRRRGRRR
jgi:Aminotransferase class-V